MAQKTSIPHAAVVGGVDMKGPQTKRPPHFSILAFTRFSLHIVDLSFMFSGDPLDGGVQPS
jgi:hypothetical protein